MTKTARSLSTIRVIFAVSFLILSARDSYALFEPTSTMIDALSAKVTEFSLAASKAMTSCLGDASTVQSATSSTVESLGKVSAQAKAAEAIGLKGTAQTAATDAASSGALETAAASNTQTGAGIDAAGSACVTALAEVSTMQTNVATQVQAQVALGLKNTATAVACKTAAGAFGDSFAALNAAVADTNKRCASDAAGGGMLSGISGASIAKTALMIGAAGAVGAGVTAAVMSGKGGKGGGSNRDPQENNVDVTAPPAATNPCGPGQFQVSPGVCAFVQESSTPTGDTSSGSANAGTADNLNTNTRSLANGSGSATGSDTRALGGGGGGAGAGVGTSGAGAGSGGGGSGSGAGGGGASAGLSNGGAQGSGLGYGGGYGGFSSGGEANGQTVAAAVVTDVYIDGVDNKGSYYYKLINGRRVKVYVNCKTKSRCKIRNELKKRIESDPLLQ